MKFTFYRPKTVNTKEYENIVGKLSYDLHQLENEKTDEWDVYSYIYAISKSVKPLEHNPQMAFLGLDDPDKMPSDARVDFFYKPTYIATAIMMKAVLLYPSLLNESLFLDSDLDFNVETVRNTLSSIMLASTARNFEGAGVLKLADCIQLFVNAGAEEFLAKYPDLCPEFNALFYQKKKYVEDGNISIRDEWYS